MSEDEKRAHARKLNMARRHLTREQRRELVRDQLRETPEKSDRRIADGLGVDHEMVGEQRKNLERRGGIRHVSATVDTLGREQPRKPVSVFNPTAREMRALGDSAVIKRIAETGINPVTASKEINRETKSEKKRFAKPATLPDTCELFQADIRTQLPQVIDDSIDFIITDPPYPREFLPLYGELSKLAARVLKPGGSLVVMCGQSYLPDVIAELSREMKYHWCMAYITPGGQSPQLWGKRTNTFWKPVLWFTKGDYAGDYIGDVFKSPPNDNDKRFHEWGQSLGGFKEIVERFTYPGQTILDPFLGGGTTGIASVTTGRFFIGTDTDGDSIEIARGRIRETLEDASTG
jgi:site-specific DNA-methyltransferase (adenine-specific)